MGASCSQHLGSLIRKLFVLLWQLIVHVLGESGRMNAALERNITLITTITTITIQHTIESQFQIPVARPDCAAVRWEVLYMYMPCCVTVGGDVLCHARPNEVTGCFAS